MFELDYGILESRMAMPLELGSMVLGSWQIVGRLGANEQRTTYEIRSARLPGARFVLYVADLPGSIEEADRLRREAGGEERYLALLDERTRQFERKLCGVMLLGGEPAALRVCDIRLFRVLEDGSRRVLVRAEHARPLTLINREQPLSQESLIRLGEDTAELLAAYSRRHMVHGSINPFNFFAGEDGRFRLRDVDRPLDSGSLQTLPPGSRVWLAPESAAQGLCDLRSDLYALALTLYSLLNRGRLPFQEEGGSLVAATARRLEGREALPPVPYLSGAFNDFLARALAFRPEDRFQTPEDFAAGLQSVVRRDGAISQSKREVEDFTDTEESKRSLSRFGEAESLPRGDTQSIELKHENLDRGAAGAQKGAEQPPLAEAAMDSAVPVPDAPWDAPEPEGEFTPSEQEALHLSQIPRDEDEARQDSGWSAENLRRCREAAEQGDAEAQFRLGECLDTGDGIEEDIREAVGWYRMAARQGHAAALFWLGECLELGDGTDVDEAEALRCWRLSAELGYPRAQHKLGLMYQYGEYVPRDLGLAESWLRRAADLGDEMAAASLAYLRRRGEG